MKLFAIAATVAVASAAVCKDLDDPSSLEGGDYYNCLEYETGGNLNGKMAANGAWCAGGKWTSYGKSYFNAVATKTCCACGGGKNVVVANVAENVVVAENINEIEAIRLHDVVAADEIKLQADTAVTAADEIQLKADMALYEDVVKATKLCDTRNCANWECKEWCHCFDEKAEHYGLYEHRGCGSDGADVCKCKTSTFYPISEEDKMFVQKASTIPEVITVEGACGTSEEANGKYTQMEVTARGKNTWVNANTGYEIKFEAGSDWGAKELIKGDGWTIFGDLHHRYYIAADGDDSFFTPPHAEWTTRFPNNCAPTLKY